MSEINDIQQFVNNVDPVEIKKMLFKKGNFDFIVSGYDEDGVWCTHEKQRKAFEILTSNKYDEFLYGGAAGGAKIVSNDGVVLTPHGWKKGEDLKVGTLLNNPDGTVQRIIAIKPEIYVDQWTVYFSDGTFTDVGKEHLWQAWKGGKGRKINNKRVFGRETAEVIQTDELKEWLDRGYNPQIPVCEPQRFNRTTREKNMIDPYLLGVLLGDGHFSEKHIGITSDPSDAEHYKSYFGDEDITYKGKRISFKGEKKKWLREKLKLHNLLGKKSKTKFIPEVYKWSSVEKRMAIVQGLMDTDGTSAPYKNGCYYTSISKQLADDVAFIIRSLGGIVTINKHKAGYKDEDGNYIRCNDAYELYIRYKDPNELFRMKRKQHGSFGKNLIQKRVVDVKITGKIRGRCITVSNPNGLYITNDFIVTHNSWTGVTWIVFMCLCYPGTRWFIARNELKAILGSVMVTLKKVCEAYGIEHPKFNAVKYFVEFPNGSHIDLIEVKYKPSDPMYEDLGSTEYTGGWIEEVGEINSMAADVISTRVGRHLNKKYGLKGTVFYTCNPKRNWAKTEFYDKHQNGQLYKDNENENNPTRIYLNCLVTENPFIEKEYVKKLRQKASTNKALYERLFKGNWDYEDNPFMLCEQEMIDIIFENDHVEEKKAFLTVDVARFGKDRSILFVWRGFVIIDSLFLQGAKITEVSHAVEYLRNKHGIPKTRCIGDDDGVGGGLVDQTGIKAFKNGSRPMIENGKRPNYKNLQVQCLYKLAEFINKGRIWINCELSNEEKEHIKEELSQIQSVPTRDESKLDCKSKAQIKQDIGRSPDYRDSILMRMYFEFDGHRKRRLGTAKRRRL